MRELIFENSKAYRIGLPTFPETNISQDDKGMNKIIQTITKVIEKGLSITLINQWDLRYYLARIDKEERKAELCNLLGIDITSEVIEQVPDYPRKYLVNLIEMEKTLRACRKLLEADIMRESPDRKANPTEILINLQNPIQTRLMKKFCEYWPFNPTKISEVGGSFVKEFFLEEASI